jgi:hypothetical protein
MSRIEPYRFASICNPFRDKPYAAGVEGFSFAKPRQREKTPLPLCPSFLRGSIFFFLLTANPTGPNIFPFYVL